MLYNLNFEDNDYLLCFKDENEDSYYNVKDVDLFLKLTPFESSIRTLYLITPNNIYNNIVNVVLNTKGGNKLGFNYKVLINKEALRSSFTSNIDSYYFNTNDEVNIIPIHFLIESLNDDISNTQLSFNIEIKPILNPL